MVTFSKHGLHAQKFRRTITPLWQPTVAKWCALESPFFWWAVALPFNFNTPQVPLSERLWGQQSHNLPARRDFSAKEMAACTSAPSRIWIGICTRYPGQHIPAKQRLICIGGDQFAFSRFCAMAPAKCFLAVAVFLLQFWAAILVFKSFLPFGSFFT